MAKINTTGSVGLQASAATCVAIEDALPRLGGALASEAPPSLFDEVAPIRPVRLVTVVCAICRIEARISFLADGKLCDVCRMDLPLAAANVASDLDKAEQECNAANEAWIAAHEGATPQDQDRYEAATKLRHTLTKDGRQYTEAQVVAALQKAILANDGLSQLLEADLIRRAADYRLAEVRNWADLATADLHAAGWRAETTKTGGF